MLRLNKFLITIICFFLISCSSNFRMVVKRCENQIELGHLNKIKGEPFFIKYKFSQNPLIGKEKYINLKYILKKYKINCKQVKALQVRSTTSWDQAIVNLIPGVSRHTLILNGVSISKKN